MEFLKLEGCGNDFVCVDAAALVGSAHAMLQSADYAALAQRLCHRHNGIGADGLMILAPDAQADAAMIFLNPDGSVSATCGNALRCAALVLAERLGRSTVRIRSGTEVRECCVLERSGNSAQVRCSMGRVELERSRIPMLGVPGRVIDERFEERAAVALRITALSLGNPHCVVFVDNTEVAALATLGLAIETDPRFPQRTNVEFVQVLSRTRLRQRTWERGVGETAACGSGACASVVAGVLNGHCERRASVELRGGVLGVEWLADHAEVLLTGPARLVFRGAVE